MKLIKIVIVICIQLLLVQCQSSKNIIDLRNPQAENNLKKLQEGFISPSMQYHPETWFHFNGNNISKEGITLDLEAIKQAGLQGIHLFSKNGQPFPGVKPIKVLSPEWEDMIRHAADECKRLGLKFTMQNCPGWSMTGGPWVPVEEAQRELVETVYRVNGGTNFKEKLKLDPNYLKPDYDYKDVQVLAFLTPEGDDQEIYVPSSVDTNNNNVPWAAIFNPTKKINLEDKSLSPFLNVYKEKGIRKVNDEDTWVKLKFDTKVMIRSITMSPIRDMILDREYPRVDLKIKVQALKEGTLKDIAELKIPNTNWTDRQYDLTLAIPETSSSEFVLTFIGEHALLPSKIHLSSKARLHNYEVKAAKALRSLEKDIETVYADKCYINQDQIINLTNKMDATGILSWNVPKGNWTVVRFGHVNMRRTNKPAMPESTGWEASKLDKIAIENHLRNGMIGKMIKNGGPIGDGKLQGLLIDSWESFIPNWTMNSEGMFKEFEQRRGYSMKPYLPATMGYIVKNPETSTKFLRDLRQTMDDVYVDNFFSHFATIAHEMGAKVYTEGAGGEVLPIDPMRYYGVSDVPMTEFWYPKEPSNQKEFDKVIYSAASAVHLYNKPVLAAEACTQLSVMWNEHPFTVKYLIDYNFTKGVNHLVFHTFSHTPQTDVVPGSSFGGNIGFPFVRNQTWWKYMPEWINFLSRNQYMLQQGEYAADVLWYYGDHFERPPFDQNYFPKGYRFDFMNAEILQGKVAVKAGKINVKEAGDYRVILLRDSKEMLLSTAIKLKELVLQGAVILGDKPIDSPSLMDDEKDLKELHSIADELWGNTITGAKQVGKGKVYWGSSIEEVLAAEQIQPDVLVPKELEDIHWIHRKTEDADIYFVSSKSDKAIDVSLSFRIENAYPQFWDAYTGIQQEASVWTKENQRTNVAVSFAPSGSVIIVFPKGDKKTYCSKIEYQNKTLLSAENGWYRIHNNTDLPSVSIENNIVQATKSGVYDFYQEQGVKKVTVSVDNISLQNNWNATFEEGWDTPKTIELSELKSLTELENKAVKHYSGTVSYTKEILYEGKNKNTIIDLGQVANIAELWCNGVKIGTRWAPPFTFAMGNNLKKGTNQLEVKVTNTWRNQLIYDNKRPKEEKKTWTTNPPKANEIELELSGLIGPVKILNFSNK